MKQKTKESSNLIYHLTHFSSKFSALRVLTW
jgi:hypothetical protein